MYACEDLGFESSPVGVGFGGGVVQCLLDVDGSDLKMAYRYADIRTLLAYHWGLLKGPSPSDCSKLFSRLSEGKGAERVNLKPSFLVRPRDHDSMLALMGLHSATGSNWPHLLQKLGRATGGHGPRNGQPAAAECGAALSALQGLIET